MYTGEPACERSDYTVTCRQYSINILSIEAIFIGLNNNIYLANNSTLLPLLEDKISFHLRAYASQWKHKWS